MLKVNLILLMFAVMFQMETEVTGDQESDLRDAINKFTMRCYEETNKLSPTSSFVASPLSTDIILALLSMAAQGQTQTELFTALNVVDSAFIQSAYKVLLGNLNSMQSVKLKIANKVYIKDQVTYPLSVSFDTIAKDVFSSDVATLNFENNISAAKTINDWVELITDNMITSLIDPKILTTNTISVLVNAISFQGKWNNQFVTADTKKKEFTLSNGNSRQVDMMSVTKTFNYAEVPEWDAEMLEMPYEGTEASFVVILPKAYNGLPAMESQVLTSNLQDKFNSMSTKTVAVEFPKIKIESSFNLKTLLPKLGINLIFNPDTADLSKLLANNMKGLYVTDALQKSVIEIDEAGTKAGASTAVAIGIRFLPDKFIADHPFMFILKAKNGQILFIGRYLGPTSQPIIDDRKNPMKWIDFWKYINGRPFNRRTIRGVLRGYEEITD